MRDQHPNLDPDPGSQDHECAPIRLCEEDVVLFEVEVRDRKETQDRLADDELPEQSLTAVAFDVPADLGNPEGEVGEG